MSESTPPTPDEQSPGSCLKLSREDVETIFKAAEQQKADRERLMPDVDTALMVLTQAFHRLKELGWREAMYCPKDGSFFEVIEAGSSGIHKCNYFGKWPNGWWISDGGDLWPSHPILWRPSKATMCPPHRWNAFGWCDDCNTVRIPEPIGSGDSAGEKHE